MNQSILVSFFFFFFFLEADLRSRRGEFKGKSFIKEMLPGQPDKIIDEAGQERRGGQVSINSTKKPTEDRLHPEAKGNLWNVI